KTGEHDRVDHLGQAVAGCLEDLDLDAAGVTKGRHGDPGPGEDGVGVGEVADQLPSQCGHEIGHLTRRMGPGYEQGRAWSARLYVGPDAGQPVTGIYVRGVAQ